MKKRIAIIGYGNIGKATVSAINSSSDFELAGIVRRKAEALNGITVTDNIDNLGKIDAAIICAPSRSTCDIAFDLLQKGISCVDSFDIHQDIYDCKIKLDEIAKKNNAVSIISAGWDPGSDSVIRALFLAMSPKGITYTNFGPGMSMGHTVCAKSKDGVADALSITIPAGAGEHKRLVYVELKDGADFSAVENAIKTDSYFAKDNTKVVSVKSVSDLIDSGHGVSIMRKGGSGTVHNQQFLFDMRIDNPALTAQIMVSCARAALKQKPGAYTMIEIPIIDLLEGDREHLIKTLV